MLLFSLKIIYLLSMYSIPPCLAQVIVVRYTHMECIMIHMQPYFIYPISKINRIKKIPCPRELKLNDVQKQKGVHLLEIRLCHPKIFKFSLCRKKTKGHSCTFVILTQLHYPFYLAPDGILHLTQPVPGIYLNIRCLYVFFRRTQGRSLLFDTKLV